MVMNPWIDFSVVMVVQLVLFFVFRYWIAPKKPFAKILFFSMLIGVPFGVIFDLIIGGYAGVYDHVLGFGYLFLFFNGLFSHGFMMTTVALWSKVTFWRFYLYSVCLGVLYEITNHFFRIWEWTFFEQSFLEYLLVVLLAYCGLSLFMALALVLFRVERFDFLTKISK